MITLVKFHENKRPDAAENNKVITKTLGKTGVLDWDKVAEHGRVPKDEEFWFVEVVREKGAGTPRGLFLLNPLEQINILDNGKPDIVRMIPGTYKTEKVGNTVLLHPSQLYKDKLGPNWICSLSVRKKIMDKYKIAGKYTVNSVIVVFDGTTDWEREEPQNIRTESPRPAQRVQ